MPPFRSWINLQKKAGKKEHLQKKRIGTISNVSKPYFLSPNLEKEPVTFLSFLYTILVY